MGSLSDEKAGPRRDPPFLDGHDVRRQAVRPRRADVGAHRRGVGVTLDLVEREGAIHDVAHLRGHVRRALRERRRPLRRRGDEQARIGHVAVDRATGEQPKHRGAQAEDVGPAVDLGTINAAADRARRKSAWTFTVRDAERIFVSDWFNRIVSEH
ncbi:hypothetical protein [Sorangium sp. So ce145]|uniref:hypothetical protein n=1 Tax=Sorangium sp. So ce145 TaxID=3133285 RepID=UPI003F5DA42F